MKEKLKELERKIGVKFNDIHYYERAFTHSSYANEQDDDLHPDNERVEFLGDAVVGLVVSTHLFKKFPELSEGELTKYRASIVREASLADFATKLDLADYILLGRGEEQSGGRTRISLLADLFEAFVGALYLDLGLAAVESFFASNIFSRLDRETLMLMRDFKSDLQEYIQKNNLGKISYHLISQVGPAHEIQFTSEVRLDDRPLGCGIGGSKKESEQGAAREAFLLLTMSE
jgi:ribonuclease-3